SPRPADRHRPGHGPPLWRTGRGGDPGRAPGAYFPLARCRRAAGDLVSARIGELTSDLGAQDLFHGRGMSETARPGSFATCPNYFTLHGRPPSRPSMTGRHIALRDGWAGQARPW